MEIKAILFGVDESVIGNLDIGENYKVKRDTMINQKLWEQFDYTVFGLRKIYETAKLNDNLDVAILTKNIKVVMARGIFRETIFKIIEKNVTKKQLLK